MSALRRPRLPFLVALSLVLGSATVGVRAEQTDRDKPMVVEADRPGTADMQSQVVVFNGNVVVTQGTLVLRADHVETRELADGYRQAIAIGTPGHPATWRQRRDGLDETMEGSADRIEFDGRTDTLRLIGHSVVRRLRGGVVADEITGGTIDWDNITQTAKVEAGAATSANPSGRVRAVLSPRSAASSASTAASAALVPSADLQKPR